MKGAVTRLSSWSFVYNNASNASFLSWNLRHYITNNKNYCCANTGADLGGGCRGAHPPPAEMTCGFLIQLVFCKKKKETMWIICVEVEQETSTPPPKKNPGSAPVTSFPKNQNCSPFQSSSSLSICAFFCICCVIYTFFSCFKQFI